MASRKQSDATDTTRALLLQKEFDEASCPICMDSPHNAVLLLCSSHDKGCRSYICDTSYRHSNCLDRFKKLVEVNNGNPIESQDKSSNLRCPMCRGTVLGWKVVEEARKYMNSKRRSCSRETCTFSGDYGELRQHARRDHPTVRPADVDPSRQRAWRRLQDEREHDDIISAVRSAMPGAVVFGDYVVEDGNRRESNGRWWTTFFLFQMIDSMNSSGSETRGGGGSGRSRGLSRHRRRRYLWGENLLGLQEDDDDMDDADVEDDEDLNALSDVGEDLPLNPRRRRRLTRSRSNEDR